MDHISTVVLFILIILWAVLWGRLSQRKLVVEEGLKVKTVTSLPRFFLALVVPWFFLAFTNIGVDYQTYYNIIESSTFDSFNDYFSWEPFFLLMSASIRTLLNENPDFVIFLYKSVSLFLMGTSIYLLRDEVRIWLSILVYMMLFYFSSFYLIAMCLASSMVSYGVVLWHKKGKLVLPLILIILAAQIHNSMYLFLPVFLLAVYYERSTSNNSMKLYLITVSFISAGVLAMVIFNWAIGSVESFHYDGYTDGDSSGSGVIFYFRFGILFYLIYMYNTFNKNLSDKSRFFIIFALGSALFYKMAYTFRVIGRMEFTLITLYYIYLPYMFNKTIDKSIYKKSYNYKLINFACFVFLFIIGYDRVSHLIVDKESPGLGRWIFLLPF